MDDIKYDPDPLMTSLRNLANRADAEGDQYSAGVARYAIDEIERLRVAAIRPDLRVGFRRRCAWCGVVLRNWQLNRCRMCKRHILYSNSPPCLHGSRWEAEPDRWEARRG